MLTTEIATQNVGSTTAGRTEVIATVQVPGDLSARLKVSDELLSFALSDSTSKATALAISGIVGPLLEQAQAEVGRTFIEGELVATRGPEL